MFLRLSKWIINLNTITWVWLTTDLDEPVLHINFCGTPYQKVLSNPDDISKFLAAIGDQEPLPRSK